jgi:hypothetical protein
VGKLAAVGHASAAALSYKQPSRRPRSTVPRLPQRNATNTIASACGASALSGAQLDTLSLWRRIVLHADSNWLRSRTSGCSRRSRGLTR